MPSLAQNRGAWLGLHGPAILALLLLAGELAFIGIVFKHAIDFECRANWPVWACRGASGTLISLYCIGGALLLLATQQRAAVRRLLGAVGGRPWAIGVNLAGAVLAFLPVWFLADGVGGWALVATLVLWTAGTALMLGGVALYLAPPARWAAFLQDQGLTLLLVIAAAALTPLLATALRPLWGIEPLANATFSAVVWTIGQLGYVVEVYPAEKIIGMGDFYISIAPVCSGIEGIALVSLFVSIYLGLFRHGLRFPLAFLLYPIGIAASALLNIVRITVLMIIGIEGHPELAVGGFHSHAGWLMFTVIALGIIAFAQGTPVLQRARGGAAPAAQAAAAPTPFWADPVAACLLPFGVFMLTAVPIAAFSEAPGVVYPLRVLLTGAVTLAFWAAYKHLSWRLRADAVMAGIVVGAYWILIPVAPADGPPPYGALTGGLLALWFLFRGLGTIVLVPFIEEILFRGYLHDRLQRGPGLAWALFAAVATAALFAALHDRWAEAFVAGLIFSWCARRPGGRVTDAVLAHAVANALVFGAAVATGNLAII